MYLPSSKKPGDKNFRAEGSRLWNILGAFHPHSSRVKIKAALQGVMVSDSERGNFFRPTPNPIESVFQPPVSLMDKYIKYIEIKK